jgi:hypothetical protein
MENLIEKVKQSKLSRFWLVTRRLSQELIRWWPEDQDAPLRPLQAQQLSVLLYNGLPDQAKFAPVWQKLPGVESQAASDSAPSPL